MADNKRQIVGVLGPITPVSFSQEFDAIYDHFQRIKIMLRTLPALVLLTLLVSCHTNIANIQSHQSIIIIDSMMIDGVTGLQEDFLMSSYEFHYLGEVHDTIIIPEIPLSDYWEESGEKPRFQDFKDADSASLSIYIDTTTLFSDYRVGFVGDRGDSSLVKSYGIFVRNLGEESIYLGSFNDLEAVQQVQTRNGEWFKVEIPSMYFCGTGARLLSLGCNDIGIAKFRIGCGKIRAKTRLVMERRGKRIYSNEFFDYVDSIPTRDLTREMFYKWSDKRDLAQTSGGLAN